MRRALAAVATALLMAAPAFAQSVSLAGSLGDKAVLIIDGAPRTLAIGTVVKGVKLVGVKAGEAIVEVDGQRQVLRLGGAQVNLGGTRSEGAGSQVVLSAGPGGHFVASGSINGKAVRFLVDTGATYVSMGAAEADRLGIDYRKGVRGLGNTANGQMVVYRVGLASVRLGDIQLYDIEALVGEQPMDHVLLGNSFLTRFQMRRENDTMTLTKRF
ncbi:MAG: TIGR02281 family clan AA aspartic protease [Burkholderiaceae bacterium]